MEKEVTLTIDGQQVTVLEGTLVVDAAKKIWEDLKQSTATITNASDAWIMDSLLIRIIVIWHGKLL